jgi:hypothetical protein
MLAGPPRPLLAGFILASAIGCNQQAGKNSPYNSSGFDVAKDEAAAGDSSGQEERKARAGLEITEENCASLRDSLSSANTDCRLRWARAAIAAWRTSDGALSEALSSGAVAYPQKYPPEFVAEFGGSDEDLAEWADLNSGELIIAVIEPFDSLGPYMDGMRQSCIGCSADEMAILDRFEVRLKSRLGENLR